MKKRSKRVRVPSVVGARLIGSVGIGRTDVGYLDSSGEQRERRSGNVTQASIFQPNDLVVIPMKMGKWSMHPHVRSHLVFQVQTDGHSRFCPVVVNEP